MQKYNLHETTTKMEKPNQLHRHKRLIEPATILQEFQRSHNAKVIILHCKLLNNR